jgi:V/A-type H+/Na+-transporting ATPase subunit E
MGVKKGLVAIADEVLGDAQKEAEAIILGAEEEAKKTLKTAKEKADQNYLSIINQAKAKAEAEKRKIISLTEVEIRNRLLQTKEELVDLAFKKALQQLEAFVKTEQYHDYLLNLIEQASKRINPKNLLVQVNAKDKAWLTQESLTLLAIKLHFNIKLSNQTKDFVGGCRIQTEDGKVTYDCTIDNQLQELKPTLRSEVAKILFMEAT